MDHPRWHRAVLAVAVTCLPTPTPAQASGSETVVALEYLGPSNEWVCPLIVASSTLSSAALERALPGLANRLGRAVLARCAAVVPPSEALELARGVRLLVGDTSRPLLMGTFRATVVDGSGEGTDGMLSVEESERALSLVDRLCPEGSCAELRSRAEELRKRLAGLNGRAGVVPLAPFGDCGARAPNIDESVQTRIVYDLTRLAPTWSVRTLLHSNTSAGRLLELTNGTLRITVSISYLATREDAARRLQCRLRIIAMPRFRPVMDIGDEAFVLSSSSLMFRTGRILLHIDASDMSLDTERTIAMRLLASIAAPAAGRQVPGGSAVRPR